MIKVKMYSIERDKTVIEDLTKEKVLTAYNKLCDTLDTLKCINTLLKECDKLDEKTKQQFKFLHLNRHDRDRLVQLDKHIGYFMLNSPFLPQIAKTLHNAKTDAVVVHPLSQDEKLEEEVLDMHVAYGLKNKKITDTSDVSNCLRSNKISTSKRNSILEELYKVSKKTRSQFVEDMRTLARKHANVNASIARVIEFEKYLKNTKVPFSYSGIVWVDECKDSDSNNDLPDSTTTEQVEGIVFAHNKQMAFNEIDEKYFYANTYEDDFLIEEISVKQAIQKAAA